VVEEDGVERLPKIDSGDFNSFADEFRLKFALEAEYSSADDDVN
jgi:hypothetical protein